VNYSKFLLLCIPILIFFACSKEEKICRKDPSAVANYLGNEDVLIFSNDTLVSDTSLSLNASVTCVNGGLRIETTHSVREFQMNTDSSYYYFSGSDSIYNRDEVYIIFEDRSMRYEIFLDEINGSGRFEYYYAGIKQ